MSDTSCSLLEFEGKSPLVANSAWLAPGVRLSGDIVVGDNASLWFNVSARGDVGPIRIGDESNVQDNSVIHVTREQSGTKIGRAVTIGHGAIIHECEIEDECLIGMGAIILDGAKIKRHSFVGAGALVTPGMSFPERSLILGSPAKAVRRLDDQGVEEILESARHYVRLAAKY